MPSAQQLREQRANVWSQMTEINDRAKAEGREYTVDEKQTYDSAETKFDELTDSIDREERHAKHTADMSHVDRSGLKGGGDADHTDDDAGADLYNEAFELFVRNGMANLEPAHRKAMRARYNTMDPKEIKAAAGIGTSAAGGYLVPQGFRADIIEKMKAYGAVQQECTVINTDTGATLPWPTNDDTGNVGALLAENTAVSEQDFVFGTAQLGAYKYTSKLVRVSLEFLQDTDWMDAEAWIKGKFAQRLGRIHNQHFTTGTGSSQPQGIVTGAVSGVTAAAVAAFTADELIDLQHSIDPAYRTEGAKFMLSDTALKQARKLKDSQNRYLFQVSTTGDMPNLLVGSPYVVNQDMAVPATGVKSVLFGDFKSGYVVRFVKAFEMIRLEERYAEFGQVGFLGFDRADGVVQDNSAYKALTQA
jgi:HK97 family phage major capsid protein